MTPFVIGILCALAIGVGASVYLWGVRRRQAEMAAGLTALAAMRWRDFAALVLRMLKERGYSPIEQHPLGSGDQTDFMMQRMGEQCVISCKHGSAYHLGAHDLKDLGNSIRLHDAASGKMVTAGQFTPDAQAEATRLRIELIDGATLWPEVAPLLPATQLQHLQSLASSTAKRQIGIAWLFALMTGVAIALLAPRSAEAPAYTAVSGSPISDPDPVAVDPAAGPQAATSAQTQSPQSQQATSPRQSLKQGSQQQESQQREQALSAITALPDIERAMWSTQSTLSVFLLADRAQPWSDICEVLARYPAVRAVRVQLTPPAGSESPVRFRQCYAY